MKEQTWGGYTGTSLSYHGWLGTRCDHKRKKNSSQEIVKGFSPKTISCRSQSYGWKGPQKNKKVSKVVSKEDIIWIKGTEGNKCQVIRSFLGTQKSPLQEKGSVLKTHLTPRSSQVQKELMLEDSASQVSSCFMTPDSQLQTWRDQNTQVVDGEAEDKSKEQMKSCCIPVSTWETSRLGTDLIWERKIHSLMRFRILTINLDQSFKITEIQWLSCLEISRLFTIQEW